MARTKCDDRQALTLSEVEKLLGNALSATDWLTMSEIQADLRRGVPGATSLKPKKGAVDKSKIGALEAIYAAFLETGSSEDIPEVAKKLFEIMQ